jgi:hypothetical protein
LESMLIYKILQREHEIWRRSGNVGGPRPGIRT